MVEVGRRRDQSRRRLGGLGPRGSDRLRTIKGNLVNYRRTGGNRNIDDHQAGIEEHPWLAITTGVSKQDRRNNVDDQTEKGQQIR